MRELADVIYRLADLEQRFSRSVRYGTVDQVRHRSGQVEVRARIGLDSDGEPLLSPWVPWAQAAGALRVHTPPTAGQQVRLIAPEGEARQATAEPFTHSDANPTPSDQLDRNVLTFGGWRIEWRETGIEISKGETKFTVSEGLIKAEIGDDVVLEVHNDKIVGRVDQSRLDVTAQQLRLKRADNRLFVNADNVAMRTGGSWLYVPASGAPLANAPVEVGPPPAEIMS